MFTQIRSVMTHLPGKTAIRILVVLTMIATGICAAGNRSVMAAGQCTPGYFCSIYEQAILDESSPQLAVKQVTHVYTGPGFDFLNYGELPIGYTSAVTGVSQDGEWWVIPLPVKIAPDGMGWVRAAAVSVKNVKILPKWLAQCDQMAYCGYVLAHTPQYVPIRQPSAGAPGFGERFPWLTGTSCPPSSGPYPPESGEYCRN